jgi:hypothetical protein
LPGARIPDNAIDKPGLSVPGGSTRHGSEGKKVNSVSPQKAVLVNRENYPPPLKPLLLDQAPQGPFHGRAAVVPGERSVSAGEIFKQTAEALGFPKDMLSATLFAFVRFFSLSPSPELIGKFRREVLVSQKSASSEGAKVKAALEAEALASVIGADKGVILDSGALEHYARFLAPQLPPEEEKGEKKESSDGKDPLDKDELPEAEEVKAIAEEGAQKDKLLGFLNNLPGKNRQHWLVFPFKIRVKGTELTVSIRILKREHSSVSGRFSSGEGERLIADIAGQKRQWRFYIKKAAGELNADIRVYPKLSPRPLEILEKDAKKFLGESGGLFRNSGGFSGVRVQNGGEIPSWVEDLCAESLLSVNKEV